MHTRTVLRGRRLAAAALGAVMVATIAAACSNDPDPAADRAEATSTTTPAASTTAPPQTAAPSAGTGGVTIRPDPVVIARSGGTAAATVAWTGQEPRTLVFVRICRTSVSDPEFDEALDCSLLSEVTPNGTPDGSGSVQMDVFRGPAPEGDTGWGCFAPEDEAPPGVQKNTTCYVRVTNDVVSNAEDARDTPFTISGG